MIRENLFNIRTTKKKRIRFCAFRYSSIGFKVPEGLNDGRCIGTNRYAYTEGKADYVTDPH